MRKLARAPLRSLIKALLATGQGLRLVNLAHGALTPAARRRFFHLCMDPAWRVEGRWSLDFAGRRIVLTLSRDFADAWAAAIGFHGYDPEVHALYERLVRCPRPPRVVFDVGANYGLHALRFLVHGARVVAFEPNPACHRWIRAWCEVNGVRCDLEPAAVGACADSVVLAFPEGRTWMGSVRPDVHAGWQDAAVHTLAVPQVTLDDVVAERGLVPDLVKIDTEGAELGVLQGAAKLLRTAAPIVVFESWPDAAERRALWDTLVVEHRYAIAAIDGTRPRPLTRAGFVGAHPTNFVAEVLPGRVIHSARQ
ncbi:MAG TPA: FkbM family methyltransferase [Methylomirabilota bacterium]|jgi:FkbM family methyltransferase|nr:FkbM family methyltransferase [Methylomirabilota bacterium]